MAQQLDEIHLESLEALPLCVFLVTYKPPARNLWANSLCLKILGISLEEFCSRDLDATGTDAEKQQWHKRLTVVEVQQEKMLERNIVAHSAQKHITVETACSPVVLVRRSPEGEGMNVTMPCCMVTQWPLEVKSQIEGNTTYQTSLLETSPYPLCFFSFDGHLITCNPAAVVMFGKTIWLQSDIFGMGERERRGLNAEGLQDEVVKGLAKRSDTIEQFQEASQGSFRIERTERRTAYENMMDALTEEDSTFQVDLPIRRKSESGPETWYCRVFAQHQTDPVTGEPIIMVSHQDVTNLRKVEGELGRMLMSEHTNKELKAKHDSDVAGSLLVLLGEDWNFQYPEAKEGTSEDGMEPLSPTQGTPRSVDSPSSSCTDSASIGNKTVQLQGLRQCLESSDEWCFDVFELEKEADGLPLQVLSWHIFLKHNLIEEFDLDHVKLVQFLRAIESGQKDNPYHSATHVADVVQSIHVLLSKGGMQRFVGRLELLAALVAALIHDFEHKGLNNDFLIKTGDEWAIDSNDRSPNEHHHLSSAFRILRQPECNFIHRMPHHQQTALRKMVIDMVLATDMAEHMAIVSRLKTDLQKRLENPDDLIDGEIPDSLKTLVLQGAIKMADIGHLYASHDVHVKWSERLEEEMWRQGDVEKSRSMKASFLMDRDKPGVTKSQPGFVDFVVRPLFETWIACFPECKVLMDRINANYEYWKSKERAEQEAAERDSHQDEGGSST